MKMNAIFYDLETSDLNRIGQILSYAFILVDDDFNVLSECCGKVQISRLQLPSATAIDVNNINVALHQADPESLPEHLAMRRISNFIQGAVDALPAGEKLPLAGYNSNSFDIHMLRTGFIRNGLNPYYFGKVQNKDLLHIARKAAIVDRDFAVSLLDAKKGKVSFTMENVARSLGLLDGIQGHDARGDIMLCIALAKHFRDHFRLDVREYNAFEAPKPYPGMLALSLSPSYDKPGEIESRYLLCVYTDKNTTYWVDPEKPQKDLVYINAGNAALYTAPIRETPKGLNDLTPEDRRVLGRRAVEKMRESGDSSVDIEQHIYRLDLDLIPVLTQAVWGSGVDTTGITNADLATLIERHWLRTYEPGGADDEKFSEKLADYARQRYGGGLILGKGRNSVAPDLDTLHRELDERIALASSEGRSLSALHALKDFYNNSEIQMALRVARTPSLEVPCDQNRQPGIERA